MVGKIQMTAVELDELQRATARTYDKLIVALVAAGKYDWQAFHATSPFSHSTCTSWMDSYCEPGRQKDMMIMSGDVDNASIAAFLITRPPIGIMGTRADSSAFLLQPGTPKGLCRKEGSVYSREWTNGVASLDCGSFTSSLPFPALH